LGCAPTFSDLPIETSFAFTNFSIEQYAVLGVRDHANAGGGFYLTPLLPPGATPRIRFLDSLGASCPDALDLRIWTFRRVNGDLPIGLDPGEAVASVPLASGEVLDIPACATQVLETYTIVNWEAPEGTARVKIAQGTELDQIIRDSGRFPNVDAAWEASGVDPALPIPPLTPPAPEPISGSVTLANGAGVEGVGVLIRTRFRVRLDDADPANDPDVGLSPPIAFVITEAQGRFEFERPAGAYIVEFFSDDFLFRPAEILLETPSETVISIAEPVTE
jgi:hypothetical protein